MACPIYHQNYICMNKYPIPKLKNTYYSFHNSLPLWVNCIILYNDVLCWFFNVMNFFSQKKKKKTRMNRLEDLNWDTPTIIYCKRILNFYNNLNKNYRIWKEYEKPWYGMSIPLYNMSFTYCIYMYYACITLLFISFKCVVVILVPNVCFEWIVIWT